MSSSRTSKPRTIGTSRKRGNGLLRDPDLRSAQSRTFLRKPGGCFFQGLVLLTQLTNLRPQFRDLSRLGGLLAVLVGGVLLPVLGDPAAHFSMPPDRTRRQPRQSHGPSRSPHAPPGPSSSSEYLCISLSGHESHPIDSREENSPSPKNTTHPTPSTSIATTSQPQTP